MKNPLALGDQGKTAKFRSIEDIFKSPQLKAKLTHLVDEAVNCKTRIHNEQQTIKDLRETAMKDIGMNPKQFNAYVSATFNNDYMVRRDAAAEMVDLYDVVIGLLPGDNSNFQGDAE